MTKLFISFIMLLSCSVEGLEAKSVFLDIDLKDSKVIVTNFGINKGYGLIASEDISKGESLVSVPLNITFTALTDFPLFPYISDLETHTVSAARFLWDKIRSKGFFNEFSKSFLSDYNLLIFWTDHQRGVLNDYAIEVFEFVFYGIDWEKDYEKMKERIRNVPDIPQEYFDRNEWIWAYSCAVAKTFDIWADKWKRAIGEEVFHSDYTKFMTFSIPVLDLANHVHVPAKDRKDMVYYLEEYDGKAHLMAQYDHKKGQEILFEYESEGNICMLSKFGFALEKNYLEEFLYTKAVSSQKCTEKKVNKNECQWVLRPFELNSRLLDYFKSERSSEFLAYHSYREDMKKILGSAKYPLRETRRAQKEYSWKYISAFNYGICQRLLVLEHIKFTDRVMLRTLVEQMKLNIGPP